MKRTSLPFLFISLLLCTTHLFGQESGKILVRSGTQTLKSNLQSIMQAKSVDFTSERYKLLLFNDAPSESNKTNLKASGITFLEYVPNNAFVVKFPANYDASLLKNQNLLGVYELPGKLKMDYRLVDWDIPEYARADDKVKVAIITHGRGGY